ncbi:hypothetical protein I0E98_17195 [Pseudomonas lalucatii]|nr:hypothetical protein [Pseudomonas lalucatii]
MNNARPLLLLLIAESEDDYRHIRRLLGEEKLVHRRLEWAGSLDQAAETRDSPLEPRIWPHRLKSGDEILAEVTVSALDLEGLPAALAALRDVTPGLSLTERHSARIGIVSNC